MALPSKLSLLPSTLVSTSAANSHGTIALISHQRKHLRPSTSSKEISRAAQPYPWAVLQNTCETSAGACFLSMGQQCQKQHQQSRIGSAERCTFHLSWLPTDIYCDSHAAEAAVGFTSATTSSQQGPDVVPNQKWSRRHTSCSLPWTSSHLHQKVRNEICADSVQYRHIQSDYLSKCKPAMEHSASWHLPAISWQLQDSSQQFPFYLSTGLRPVFTARCYACAVQAIGLCVCLSVCLSVSLYVTSRSSTKTDKRSITQTTTHDSPGTQVFWRQRSPRNSTGSPPTRAPNADWVGRNRRLSTNNRLYL